MADRIRRIEAIEGEVRSEPLNRNFSYVESKAHEAKEKAEDTESRFSDLKDDIEEDFNNLEKDIRSKLMIGQGDVYQKRVNRLYFGPHDDPIFSGAQRANQGLTYVYHNNKEKAFTISRVEGSSWEARERQRITEFHLNGDGGDVPHVAYSNKLALAHQGISGIVEGSGITFICGANTGDGINAGKGFSEVRWRGSDTDGNDVTTYKLFGDSNSTHKLNVFNHATPCITPDGSKVILATSAEFEGGARYCFVYDRHQIKNSSNPLNVEPLNIFRIEIAPFRWGNVVQDITTDGTFIYIAVGSSNPKDPNSLIIHDMTGKFYGWYRIDGSIGDYSIDELEGKTSRGIPKRMEPEGLSKRNGRLLYQTTDEWEDDKGNYTQRFKVIHELTNDPVGAQPINRGWQSLDPPSGLHLPRISTNLSYDADTAFSIGGYDRVKEEMNEILRYSSQHQFRLHDIRDSANKDQYAVFSPYFDESQYVVFRSRKNNDNGSGANFHTKDSSNPGRISLHFGQGSPGGEHRIYFNVSSSGSARVYPREDKEISLGSPSNRFKEVYADEGSIKTSDERLKQDIKPIDDKVLDAWADVDYVEYRKKHAVEEKGEKARKHIGVIAQRIVKAFEDRGLNAFEYGIVGYDEWDYQPEVKEHIPEERDEYGNVIKEAYTEIVDDEVQAGAMYSIRADECMMLESALMRRELTRLKGG